MRTLIRRLGNSQGVLIPKPVLAQVGLEDEADMVIENSAIVLRKPRAAPRAGWAEASRALAAAGEDAPIWPEFASSASPDLSCSTRSARSTSSAW